VEFRRSSIKNNDRTIPVVIFNDCDDLKFLIRDWLGNEKTVSENMGLLMFKLGILSDSNDIVQIYNFNKSDCSFKCSVNNKDIYNIRFKCLNMIGFNTLIEVSYLSTKNNYECIPIDGIELGMRVIQKEHSVYQNGVCYTRSLSRNETVFTIRRKHYVLEFGVSKPNDVIVPLFGDDGYYAKYELDNESELVKYLTELNFTESIVDIYKEICRISLGDVIKYPRVFIKVYIDNFKSQRITNLIHLENGQLEKFGMSIDGTDRIVFVDKDDNWVYEMYSDDSYVKISSDVDGNKTDCNLSFSSGKYVSTIQKLMSDNMKNAREDIESVKVRVRSLFDESKLKYWVNRDSD